MQGHFACLVQDATGRRSTRRFFAFERDDVATLRRELHAQGLLVLSIRWKPLHWWQREAFFKREDQIDFLNAVLFQLDVNDSPGQALKTVVESETRPRIKQQLQPALDVLSRGSVRPENIFTDALAAVGMFGRGTMQLLRAGEAVGALRDALRSAVEALEEHQSAWKTLTAPLVLIGIEAAVGIAGVFATKVWFVPYLRRSGVANVDELEVASFQALVERSDLHLAWLLYGGLGAVTLAVLLAAGYAFGPRGLRALLDGLFVRVPLLRALMLDSAFALSFSIVGRMVQGGARATEAFEIARESSYIPMLERYWSEVRDRALAGQSIGQAMRSPLLRHGENVKLAAHQNVGQLARVLVRSARMRADLLKRNMRRVLVLATWVLMVYMGLSVWALWDVTQVQSQGLTKTFEALSNM